MPKPVSVDTASGSRGDEEAPGLVRFDGEIELDPDKFPDEFWVGIDSEWFWAVVMDRGLLAVEVANMLL